MKQRCDDDNPSSGILHVGIPLLLVWLLAIMPACGSSGSTQQTEGESTSAAAEDGDDNADDTEEAGSESDEVDHLLAEARDLHPQLPLVFVPIQGKEAV